MERAENFGSVCLMVHKKIDTDRWTDRQMNRQTDGQTDGRTDRPTDRPSDNINVFFARRKELKITKAYLCIELVSLLAESWITFVLAICCALSTM